MPAHGGKLLPVVKFAVVEPPAVAPPDVANPQLASYGYNDGTEWPAYHDAVHNGDGGRYLRWLRESILHSCSRQVASWCWASLQGRASAAAAEGCDA